MNIIILGPQGSGKGTQAKLLASKLGLFRAEAGNLIREEAKKDKRINEIINKQGKLIPHEEAFSIITKYVEENDPDLRNFILDGYPRSIRQYELLKGWLEDKNLKIDKVILLNTSEKESVRRLSARRICEKCGTVYNLITNPPPKGGCRCGGELTQREDDRPEAIRKRLNEYKKQTMPVIDLFKKDRILMKVNGERPVEVIFKDILGRLGAKND